MKKICNNCGNAVTEIKIEERPKKEPVELEEISSETVVVQKTEAEQQEKLLRVKKEVLGRNAIILTVVVTGFFVVPCMFANFA